MVDMEATSARVRWARFRFGIIATLLSSPPVDGERGAAIAGLAAKSWRHPTTGEAQRISGKTIERWYYTAKGEAEPIVALERKVPSHAGTHPSITPDIEAVIRTLRHEHPRWTFQLVYDNLKAIARERRELGKIPGYATVCRFMKHHGLVRGRRPRRHEEEPGFVPRERRSFEMHYVHCLWHCDFHDGRRRVVTSSGALAVPVLFGLLDDRSRLCCHAQWYLGDERTEVFVHGFCQGLQKRGLPRGLLSDNGSAMLAAEAQGGLSRLSIEHYTTLAQTPEQNGKQEVFWGQVEGRLMAMLEGEKELTLELLNRATQAWVEQEYNQGGPQRDQGGTRLPLADGTERRPPLPEQRRAAPRLPHGGDARPAQERRHHHRRGCPLRAAQRLPHPPAPHGARGAMGPLEHRPGRPTPRHPARDAVPHRQGEERRPPPPRTRGRHPHHGHARPHRHRALAASAHGRVRRHRTAARLHPARARARR